MLQILTPLTKIHRPVRPIKNDHLNGIGTWGYIDSDGYINRIPNTSTSQSQPQVLKLFFNGVSTLSYESNDTKGGKISTLEGQFRAIVDTAGFQEKDTDGNTIAYPNGASLTPAYRITSTASADDRYAVAADIGKLRPAYPGDLVVAEVDNRDTFYNTMTFITVSPHPFGGDDTFEITGIGRLIKTAISADGAGNSLTLAQGSGDMINQLLVSDGSGNSLTLAQGSGEMINQAPIVGGVGHDPDLDGFGEMINQPLVSDGVGVR